jgi:8-oxo-dGTP pyrophosphatase MutT (NUDIX family)
MYCNNCGERGHLFKACSKPVISYGIILVDKTLPCEPKSVKTLMIRRKHSMAYTEFIRGKYDLTDIPYIQRLMSNMTFGEQMIISEASFSELWTSHWGEGHDAHTHEYEVSCAKFQALNLKYLLKGLESGFLEPEWGFPKGRRMHRETDWNCAVREFSEETNIDRSCYTIFKNLSLSETFFGTNGVQYKHTYYIATLTKDIDLTKLFTDEQNREVSLVEWKTIQQCRDRIRPHYSERNALLDSLSKILTTFSSHDNIAFE